MGILKQHDMFIVVYLPKPAKPDTHWKKDIQQKTIKNTSTSKSSTPQIPICSVKSILSKAKPIFSDKKIHHINSRARLQKKTNKKQNDIPKNSTPKNTWFSLGGQGVQHVQHMKSQSPWLTHSASPKVRSAAFLVSMGFFDSCFWRRSERRRGWELWCTLWPQATWDEWGENGAPMVDNTSHICIGTMEKWYIYLCFWQMWGDIPWLWILKP